MSLTAGGVTLPFTGGTGDSGTSPVTNDGGDNGSIWDDLLKNAGGILIGGAAVIDSLKGNQKVTNVYQSPGNTGGAGIMNMGNIWLWLIIALVVIVVLFLALKK